MQHEVDGRRGAGVSDVKESNLMPPPAPAPQQDSPSNNVGELVAKAKKAAASLWMILHAQVRHRSHTPLRNFHLG